MVPNGWNILALSEITKEKISYGIVQAGPHVDDGIPYIKSADVGGEIDVESLQRTAKEIHHKYRRSSVHPNDIVFSLRGNIARTSIVPNNLPEANLTQGTARISVNDENDTKFVYYKLASVPLLNKINSLSKGSTFKEISLEELRKVKLSLPPIEQQRKIATILSTWDKAISTTERLIDNSKQQKKALMQQLLTGKKRLLDDSGKPFEGEWEEITLEKLAKYRRGSFPQPYGNPEWVDEVNGYPFIQVYDIDKNMKLKSDTKIKISDAAIGKSVFIPKDTVIVSLQGSIGRVAITQYDAYVDRTVLLFQEFIVPMDKVFFAFIIQELFEIEKTKAPGGTIKTITKEVLSNFKVHIPSITEQQKIASVLINADKEIELLQQQLTDLKQEKKVLMQQLLTGKRRVKVEQTDLKAN